MNKFMAVYWLRKIHSLEKFEGNLHEAVFKVFTAKNWKQIKNTKKGNECTYFQTVLTGEMGRYATPMHPTRI